MFSYTLASFKFHFHLRLRIRSTPQCVSQKEPVVILVCESLIRISTDDHYTEKVAVTEACEGTGALFRQINRCPCDIRYLPTKKVTVVFVVAVIIIIRSYSYFVLLFWFSNIVIVITLPLCPLFG